jgi:hypothetical protein
MFRKCALILVLFLVACSHSDPGGGENTVVPSTQVESRHGPEPSEIATALPVEAVVVKKVYKGSVGAPVVVIEESHDSRAGQLEVALVLSRLHERFGLKDIVLEGFLKEEDHDAQSQLRSRGTTLERARYAARLVGEGEISGAELAALVFADVVLHPAETSSEYEAGQKLREDLAFTIYLGQVALSSLDAESAAKAAAYVEIVQAAPGEASEPAEAQRLEKVLKGAKFAIELDPWSKDAWSKFQGDKASSQTIEEEIALVESVIERGNGKRAEIPAEIRGIVDNYLNFLRKRSAASVTIVNSVASVADNSAVQLAAVNIGAGHTEKVCDLLTAAGRSFVLVSPNSLRDESGRGRLTLEQMERKDNRESIQDGFLGSSLRELYPVKVTEPTGESSAGNKPQPVMQQEWFQAKAELYASATSVAAAVGGGGQPPGGGGQPPNISIVPASAIPPDGGDPRFVFVWAPDDPRRKDIEKNKRIVIDPDRIEVLYENGKPRVLFEAVLKDSSGNSRSLWVKAGLVEHLNPGKDEPGTVEEILKRELDKTKEKDPDEPPSSARDVVSVQIDLSTKAVFAATRNEAIQVKIQD